MSYAPDRFVINTWNPRQVSIFIGPADPALVNRGTAPRPPTAPAEVTRTGSDTDQMRPHRHVDAARPKRAAEWRREFLRGPG